ncbi:hypothetical protein ACWO4B_003822 [Clostridium sporogenes]
MNYGMEINYLKNKLKYSDDFTEYEIYNIKEEIKALEIVEQKQNLRNKLNRKYQKMISDNDNSIDKRRCLSNSILNIKNNWQNLEENLLGKFSDSVLENLKIHDKELKMFKNNIKDFEKSIKMQEQ